MGGSSYNPPVQPGYGDSMREALDAQVALLSGKKVGASDFRSVGKLEDLVREYEEPLRMTTAQLDTDVMRQTLLGGMQSYDDQGRRIIGYEKGERQKIDPAELKAWEDQREVLQEKIKYLSELPAAGEEPDTGRRGGQYFQEYYDEAKFAEAEAELDTYDDTRPTVPDVESTPIYSEPDESKIGKKFSAGGMVDLVGDSRAVQEQTQSEDYAQYVKDNTDLQADFNAIRQAGEDITIEEYGQQHYDKFGKAEGRDLPMGEYSLQDTGDQAGFRDSQFMGLSALAEDIGRGSQQRAREADIADVERLGGRATDAYRSQGDLGGALAEARAMGAGGSEGLSAIPADPLFDGVATNSLAARTALENANISAITGGRTGDYDPRALPPIQRPMYTSPGGEQPLQRALDPLPAADYQPPLERSSALAAPRSRDSAQGSGVMSPGTFQIPQQGQAAANQQAGSAGLGQMQGQGQQAQQYAQPGGTDAFRSALMQQGMGALDQGLSERENRAVQEAARARSTNMGRTFDQTASIDESRAVIEEDNARRMQNRAFAQSALGQEVGIQQADMARGLQAQQMELGRQSAGVDRQLTAEEKDIERQMRMQSMEEQYRQQGLGAERANAAQMVGLEQATSADPFQAILQRQGQNNLASGGAVFGQAGYGLNSGPQYLNPEAGLGFIQNQATNAANMYGAQIGADATKTAGMWSGLGSLAGSLGGAAIMKS
jgi:hypothetical protein